MASLKDAAKLTDDLSGLVDQLKSELQDGGGDFDKLVALADQISERADGMAETFNSVNETLMQRIDNVRSGSSGSTRSRAKAGSRG
jgi:ABC-type transporter Mla subunit MlaD